jgi:tRNA G18 (ribose-2'-O)-methylase SpoU
MKKLKLDELGRPDIETYRQLPKKPLVVILDNVRSMNNVGSIFRTADAFAVQKLYLCGVTPRPPHRDIHKTALGATESVEWEYKESAEVLVGKLKASGYKILAAEQTTNSIPLTDFTSDPEQPLALVLGNEVDGVGEEVLHQCDSVLEIPQFGTKHSLNVSVAAGIMIFSLTAGLALK